MSRIKEPVDGERGISQVASVTLMVAVALVLTTTVGLLVLDLTGENNEEKPLVSIETELNNGELVMRHSGGDTLSPEDVEIRVDGGGESDTFKLENKLSDRFKAGAAFGIRPESASGNVLVQVVHEPTNTVLYDESRVSGPTVQVSSSDSISISDGGEIETNVTIQRGFFAASGSPQDYNPEINSLATRSDSVPASLGTAQTGATVKYRIAGTTVATDSSVNIPKDGGQVKVNFSVDTSKLDITKAVNGSASVSVTQTVEVTSDIVSGSETDALTVKNNSIKKALKAVKPGGTVEIKDGPAKIDFNESVDVDTKNITVKGVGGTPTVAGQSQNVFDIAKKDVTLSGLEVQNPTGGGDSGVDAIGVRVQSGSTNVEISGLRIEGIATDPTTNTNGRGIQVQDNTDGLTITGTTITDVNGSERSFGIQVFAGGGSISNLQIKGNTIKDIRWNEKLGTADSGGPSLTRGIAVNGKVSGDILNNNIKNLRGEASATYPRAITLVAGGGQPAPRDITISGNSFSDIGTNKAAEIVDTPASEFPSQITSPPPPPPQITSPQNLKFATHINVVDFASTTLTIENNNFNGKTGPANSQLLPDNTDVYVAYNRDDTPFSGSGFLQGVQKNNNFNRLDAITLQNPDFDGKDESKTIVPVPSP